MSRTRVKICGITRREDAVAAVAAGADAIGLVFYGASPRAVDFTVAGEIVAGLPPMVSVVGLFVDAERAVVESACSFLPLSLLQFHGEEDPGYCHSFGKPWMKAIRVGPDTDILAAAAPYGESAAILLDSFKAGVPGGTGTTFDWSRIPDMGVPVVLAGGLSADNVPAAICAARPYGVDVSGGVEDAPGRKSPARIREFLAAVRAADEDARAQSRAVDKVS